MKQDPLITNINKKNKSPRAPWVKKSGAFWVHKDQPRNLRGNALVAYKKTLTLTELQKEILLGSLLGDGFLEYHRASSRPVYKYCLAQTWRAADYVESVYQIFKPFAPCF